MHDPQTATDRDRRQQSARRAQQSSVLRRDHGSADYDSLIRPMGYAFSGRHGILYIIIVGIEASETQTSLEVLPMEEESGTHLTVQRSKESWTSLWVILAIVLSIEGTVIQMIPYFAFPKNLIALVLATFLTFLVFRNDRFQNWLLIQIRQFEKGLPR